jgi:hypothetical protein
MTHLTGKGVRVQLTAHLSARVVYTTDTPTSLYYINTPTSLYDGGAYTGGCIRGMYDGCSVRSRYTHYTHPSLYITQCMLAYGAVPSIACAAYIPQTPLRPVHEPSLNTNIGGLVPSRSVQYIYYSHPFLYDTQCTYGELHREGCVRVPRSAPRVTSDTGCTAQLQRGVPAGPCRSGSGTMGGRV